MCRNTNEEYQISTLELGVKIGFDRFGIQNLVGAPMDEERIDTLVRLLNKGYESQIMLSHDSINYWMGRPPEMSDEVARLVRDWHPTHLFENIVPELKERGVQYEVIESLFHL